MKKILIMLIVFLFIPTVKAKTEVLDFKETLEKDNIELLNEEYMETEEQVTIYLFWTKDCDHCYDFLMFLNSISLENGYLFKVRSYEVSDNNYNLNELKKIASHFNEDVNSVPYIVIGESTFRGYSDEYNEKIIEVLKSEYSLKDKYDVFKEIEKKSSKVSNIMIIILVLSIGTICLYKIFKMTK